MIEDTNLPRSGLLEQGKFSRQLTVAADLQRSRRFAARTRTCRCRDFALARAAAATRTNARPDEPAYLSSPYRAS